MFLFFASCKKDDVYNVPNNIQPYIDEFIAEAAARGIDLTIDDLIVLFEEDLEVDGVEAAGICQSGGKKNTPTIKIDTTSLNWTINLSAREQLIFHELGHCVLGRPHTDERMPNGNYRSTMRPTGEQIYGPLYSSFKRDYYFDELFDEEAETPEWAIGVPEYNAVSSASKTLAFEETFSTSTNGWSEGTSSDTKREIVGGVYKLTLINAGSYFVGNELEIDDTKDFDLEISATIPNTAFTGFLWGGLESPVVGELPSFNSFFVGQDVASIGTINNGSESSYQYEEYITSGFNKITIRKLGSEFIFYINEKKVDNLRSVLIPGEEFGIPFGGSAGIEIQIDNIRLYYIQ